MKKNQRGPNRLEKEGSKQCSNDIAGAAKNTDTANDRRRDYRQFKSRRHIALDRGKVGRVQNRC